MAIISAIEKREREKTRLEEMTIKELRRQAALKDVPLSHISLAVEKADLINMIMRAGPVRDHYGVDSGVKVHSAESIAKDIRMGVHNKKKKKKKKKRKSSTSSSNSVSSGKRKKRSRSRAKKKSRSREREQLKDKPQRIASRSPSVELVVGGPLALPAPKRTKDVAQPRKSTSVGVQDLSALALPAPATLIEDEPDVAQAGMVAAAALGFDVLPKAKEGPAAPMPGLRPSINSAPVGQLPGVFLQGGRVCIKYLMNARCEMGNKCPDAHITDPEEEMRIRGKFKLQLCHAGASCQRIGCLFRHPGERLDEATFIPESQQGVLYQAAGGAMQLSRM